MADNDSDKDGGGEGRSLTESLLSQLGEHREVLQPVAMSAAAAAATYAAKKLPEFVEQLESGGGERLRGKLEDASDSGGVKGFAAGAAHRALSGGGGGSLFSRLTQGGEEEAESEARQSGGLKGAAAKVGDKLGNSKKGGSGWGKGRRLPIMQSTDVAAPIQVVYDQWTQFEELGSFLHRVESVEQDEDAKLTWHENIWGRRRHWSVEIQEQVPNERIQWEVRGGGQGTGMISFHELAPRLTRVEVLFDWQPSGFVEKLASGLRYHNRASKSDLARFKAFVEIRGEASGGWHGRIEDGEVKGSPRNKRNSGAEAVPEDARQHSESEKEEASEAGGDQESQREDARDQRRRSRQSRQSGQR
jgi:uncharacterized membrane protein